VLRVSITGLRTHPHRIVERRLRLRRRTQYERDQDGDGGNEPGGVRHAGVSAHGDVMSDPNPTAGRSKLLRKETDRQESRAEHGVQSPHPRKVRLVIRVDEGLGCRLHPLQRLRETHRRSPSVPY
jgi:hypothetical protein